ncbi:Very-high-density lipoprotein receptor [Operophtera brumata]|uniref:Very-high-density lipoprotein receptor n=1 Tax=Operophtera brumata TaxID=104452 RepID=A0A0L7LMJ1_OPEBR|nr:Very-high-density lipoprotein receptor [Operophtera brumata]
MRAILLVVLGLASMAMARPTVEDLQNMDLKQRQMIILNLLSNILEPVTNKDIEEIGKSFKLEDNVKLFTKTDVVKNVVNMLKVGTLPRGEIFTLHVDQQMKEVISMFHLLYYAKDFASFIQTACWMRVHMNEGMFVYALTVASRHREDCKGIVLPAPYEIYPYYYVRADVIQKAYLIKMKKGLLDMKLCDFYGIKKTDKGSFIIDENVYDKRVYLNDEDRLRYFTEDIDLNTYYYYFHVDYPFWMKETNMNKFNVNRRFELILYVYQQILARYYLERLSNGLGNIAELSWNKPIRKGYWPWMMLHNGVQIPMRLNNQVIVQDPDIGTINLVESYEQIIREAIIKGYIEINGLRLELTKPDDIEVLGKLIYGKIEKTEMECDNCYTAYRYLLVIMKSKRLVNFVILFKKRLPCYTREDLYFPGVKIDNVLADKMVTYFDDYLMDITNAVGLTEDEIKKSSSDMTILARKRRMNHEPFKVTLDVMSDKEVGCVVKIFLGPKKDHLGRLIDINMNRFNFVELDSFIYNLVNGKNTIVRNSFDMHNLVPDRIMTRDWMKKLETITDIKDMLMKDMRNMNTGFPTRLLLPKGRVGGMEMMLYVIVYPLKLVDNVDLNILDQNRKDFVVDFRSTVLLDKMPLGFPLDRYINVSKFFTPNMKFVDVTIFHKQKMCDMRTRWNRYVLKDFNMADQTMTDLKGRQLVILKLLNHVLDPNIDKEIEETGRNFKIDEKVHYFTNVINILNVGTLPRGEIFTLNIERQLKEVVSMFHLLYYAKDFSSFIETACWMRLHMNEGMFVYALTVACRHREDCRGIILPAPYEVYPYYYVRADVIQKAYLIKMKNGLLDPKLCDFYGIRKTEKGIFVIDENIFDKRVNLNDEDRLRYFTEDIDLNTYYYYFHVDYPFWMKDQTLNKFNVNRRYELTLYVYQQILARYYLERLSNGLGNIVELSWHKPIRKGYWPWMMLHNGVQFPVRFNNQFIVNDKDVNAINLVETYEYIIREAILKGFIEIHGLRLEITKAEDIETLGKLIFGKIDKTHLDENSVTAYRYLLLIMKSVLGLNTLTSDKYFVVPSILDSYQTALRDPVFYQLQKRLVNLVVLFKKRLPSYTREELYFPGVKIDNVLVDKLVTYFDDYLFDITNAVVLTEAELKKTNADMEIFARKRRLNHEPFKVTLDVYSDKTTDSVVKIFLGPKYDHLNRLIDINANRLNFVELDSFTYKLVTGKNTITRNSIDMHNLVRDRLMTRDLIKKLETNTDLKNLLFKDLKNVNTGFPTRLLLPRGRVGGLDMILYVFVCPLRPVENVDSNIFDTTRKDLNVDFRSTVLLDKMPLGFPLDRHINIAKFFAPNMKFVDVTLFHKQQVCDMKSRWNKYVLRDYNLLYDRTSTNTYLVDSNINDLTPEGWIHMQKLIFPLFENVCEESSNPMIVRLSQEFISTTSAAEFWQLKSTNSLLAKGEIFTEYNLEHVKELKIVIDVLYNAKTFDSFYKAASWARQNLNCGLYVDAIYRALENRKDTEKLTLPAPYELLPNYFIRKDIIIQGSSLLDGQEIAPSAGVRNEGNAYTLDANYTANIYDTDDELKLAYYREDVGLNSYYFLSMLKCAPWRNIDVDINSRYGEEMYHLMKQWMSRYNMERYSNGMAEIDGMSWDVIADIPYDPMLVYSNGNEFIHKTTQINVEENEDKALLQTIETNLATVVGHMRGSGYNRTQILNHLIEILVTGERSYDTLARRLLGKALSNNGNPSVLEHYMTSLRDPLFWKLNKKIVDLVDNSLKDFPPYTKNELYFPGVEVVNVEVKKMMTSFDYFEFDVTDALKIGNGDTTFKVKIGQPRLTHKPFTIKISISSLVAQKGMLKVYLGPIVMPGEFSKNKNLFGLLDSFDINLKKGDNVVTRSSEDMTHFSSDFVSLQTLRKKVEDAQFGLDSLPLNSINSQIQYPSRMILPKGTPEGLPLQLFVFVAPYMKTSLTGMYSATSMEFNEAIMSKLYPLDLPIDDNMLLGLPNLMFKDITVTHKAVGNGSSSATYSSYGRPSQPKAWGSGQFGQDFKIPVDNYDIHQMVQNDIPVQGTKQTLNYDYASKNNGDYKTKYPYDKSNYSSYKKFDYKNINKDVTVEPTNVPTEVPLVVPTEIPDDIEIIDMPDTVDYDMNLAPFEMQNDGTGEETIKISKKNVNYKPKQPYQNKDYLYKKFDYKNLNKDTTIKPKEIPTQIPFEIVTVKNVFTEINKIPETVVSVKNGMKVDEVNTDAKETITKDVNSMEILRVLQLDEDKQEIKLVPMLKLSLPKQEAFTIYDYIIHSINDDEIPKTDSIEEEEKKEEKKKPLNSSKGFYINTSS